MNTNAVTTTNNNLVAIPDTEKVYGDITLSDIKNSNINLADKEILLARYGEKKVKDLDANYVGEQIKTLINLTIFQSGYKTENISELIIMVVKDIFMDFSFMTVSEIGYAFRKGLRGEFGEYMGLSVKTFYSWLKEYNQTLKLEANKSLVKVNKATDNIISDEQKKKTHRDWLNSYIEDFEKYKNGEEIEIFDVGGVFYAYCISNGISYLSDEEKSKLYQSAKRNVIKEHSPNKAKNSIEVMEFKKLVTSIAKEDTDKSTNQIIISEAKRLAILTIFDKLIANGINLSTLVEQIENQK